MKKYYWMRTCVHCGGQGRLLMMKDLSRDSLYLHCEECEWGWRKPETAGDVDSAFLTLEEDFEVEPASREEIELQGWSRHVAGEFQA